MSSSSQYYLILCLFLLSFSSLINSEETTFVVIVSNDTPDTVNTSCSVFGRPPDDVPMESGKVYKLEAPINPDGNNIVTCKMKYHEKQGDFKLFDLNDTSVCHTTDKCYWFIRDEGLCMFVQDKCVMFKWNTTSYFRHIEN